MNDLNTQQIVLLCLLVSFVSSVATGITTVSLLDQAPEPVAQTINRVVERTIEKVVDPVVESVSNVATNRTPERVIETVVVNQEDLTVDAVEKNSRSLVRIYGVNSVTGVKTFAGLGVVVSNDGKILTSSTILEMSRKFQAEYAEGSYEIDTLNTAQNGVVMFMPKEVEEGKSFASANFGNSDNIKLGQSVIAISGQERNLVSTGIVNSLEAKEEVINLINTSIPSDSIIRGSVLINLKGEIVGMRVMGSSGGSFISSNVVRSSMGI